MAVLTKSTSSELYTATLGGINQSHADAVVALGGKSLNKFVPNINASKWNDEFYLNINNKKVVVGSEKQVLANSKVDLIVGNDCHRYYIDVAGQLEYEIIFSSQPSSAEILLDLKCSKGLEFCYQPALTADEIARGCVRPDNVVGSYAVYCNKANNKYQTGKVSHIYRPFLRDNNGVISWCTLYIDPSAGVIQILMDEKWLAAASYPVTLDPTIGYATAGASSASANYLAGSKWTCSESGAANPGTIYAYYRGSTQSSGHVVMGVYADNDYPTSKIAQCTAITGLTANTWHSGAITWTGITSGTTYWLMRLSDTAGCAFDNATEYQGHYVGLTYTNTLPATASSYSLAAYRYSVYADYSATGAGLSIPVAQNYYNNMRH